MVGLLVLLILKISSEQKKNVDFKKKANILIEWRKVTVMKRDVTEVLLDAKVLRDGPNNAA